MPCEVTLPGREGTVVPGYICEPTEPAVAALLRKKVVAKQSEQKESLKFVKSVRDLPIFCDPKCYNLNKFGGCGSPMLCAESDCVKRNGNPGKKCVAVTTAMVL